MKYAIDQLIESGFVDWVEIYWPWSGYLAALWFILLLANAFVLWWDDKK